MERLGVRGALQLFLRGNVNYLTNKPFVVSFELTSSCNANCRHCDKGGIRRGESHLSPEEIGEIYRKLRPVAVQLSGGEPLLREDVVDVVRQIKERNRTPYLILVTNGRLLHPDLYLRLRREGVDQFSISLDFQDERHDEFRALPGLFRHLSRLVPELTAYGNQDIVVNTAITRLNLEDLIALCETASGWQIRNPVADLENIYRFFAEDGIEGCRAGYRFLLVTPEGYFRPCAHKPLECRSRRELIEQFSSTNTCRGCYVAIRSYCDKPYGELVREEFLSRFLRRA